MGIYTHRYTRENQIYLIDECQKNLSALVRTEQISKQLNLLSFNFKLMKGKALRKHSLHE